MTNLIRCVLVDDDSQYINSMCDCFEKRNTMEVVGIAHDGEQAIRIVEQSKPDIVFLDLGMQNFDGLQVLKHFSQQYTDAKFIVVSNITNSEIIDKCFELGASHYMNKPVSPDMLERQAVIFSTAKNRRNSENSTDSGFASGQLRTRSIDEKLSTIFITVGIPPHIKGYQFLREGVKLAVDSPEMINYVTKKLYPSIAKIHKTTPSKVERAIRHAIEVSWSRGKIENINNVFGMKVYTNNEKPTNSEFIALVADKMLLEGCC